MFCHKHDLFNAQKPSLFASVPCCQHRTRQGRKKYTLERSLWLSKLPFLPANTPVSLQAGVHFLQTEGSKMVMALCQTSYNQGVYGLVTNLGSLVVRTIFFPVEEAAFRAFSRPPGAALAL